MGKKIDKVIVKTITATFEPFKSQYCRLSRSHLRSVVQQKTIKSTATFPLNKSETFEKRDFFLVFFVALEDVCLCIKCL